MILDFLFLIAALCAGAVAAVDKSWPTIAFAVALAALAAANVAHAHSFYESECCSGVDCYPVAEGEITEAPDGYTVKATGEFIDRRLSKVRMSPDGRWHRCSEAGDPARRTLCIYVPGRGA
jgi:hypothetical protein